MSKKITVLGAGKYLRLVNRDGWEFVERVNCRGVVIVIALTDIRHLVLVEQFRHPVQKFTIGFPAGLVGDDHGHRAERPEHAAVREMIEETGYKPSKIRVLFKGPMSAGMSQDMMTIVYASGLKKVGDGGGVGEEEKIKVHEVPLDKADVWLKRQARNGKLVGPNVYAGLYFLEHWIR